MLTDIEIASKIIPQPITKIAEKLGIPTESVEPYGLKKAKVNYTKINPKAKLILVSAITPTPAGEGKTTVSIGLTDALSRIGKNACVCIREPSLGPVFGVKGGAAGGGYAQVIPMEEINLHFTGDIHAISAANNLLAAMLDNHIHQGNELRIHPKKIALKRCIDLNDRALRNIVVGLGGPTDGQVRDDGFYITAASEVMAILCLASNIEDLKTRLGNILVAYNYDGGPVYARDLKAENALAILLREAFKPNLVQTLEGTPAFVHGGPFANIAHGCNSVIATKTAMTFSDYVVTEAGFGADLGAEKFLDIKCRQNNLSPSCVVIVATVRALKMHGGVSKTNLATPNAEAVRKGCENLKKHLENITLNFRLTAVVAINRFEADTNEEIEIVKQACLSLGVKAEITEVFLHGGAGGEALAHEVVKLCENNKNPEIEFLYDLSDSIDTKITKICVKNYGAGKVTFSPKARNDISKITEMGYGNLPVVIAKTQYSFSEDPTLVGRPSGFEINIREVQLRSGSHFVVAIAGDIMLMPGLPKIPAANNMILNADGSISGLS
ncbi:c-1-tetrahydrofolate synthase cytoplasmic-related [Holotrichia oblita]|nr:c-1-tetrahydrofolate synthase cytoplasmic-related [Holotrichia oblita]